MVVQIKVRGPAGEEKYINLCDTEEQLKRITVLQLKEKIESVFGITGDGSDLRLIFRDKLLESDSDLLSRYGIKHMSVILVVLSMPGGGGDPGKGDGGMGDKEGKNRTGVRPAGMAGSY